MQRRTAISISSLILVSLLSAPIVAGTFRRTKEMDVYYAFGVHDWSDFDAYEANGWIPYAEVTMYNDGTLDAYDTASGQSGSGTYNKQGRFLDLDLGPNIGYSGERVSRGPTIYEGIIIYHGQCVGLWRGYFR